MIFLVYVITPIFVGISIYFLKRYYQKRKIKDVHFEVMERGTRSERFRYTLLGIAYLLSFLLLTVLLTYLTYFLRTSSIDLTNVIYSDFGWSKISFLPWLFFSIVILALPLELLQFKLFPNKVSQKNQKWHLKQTYITIIITILLTIPSVFLLFDFYKIVTPNEIIKNDFLRFSEDHYLFNEITSINIDGYLKKIRFHLDIIINLKNGDSFELFNSGSLPTDQEIEVIKFLKKNNVPMKITQQPSEEDFNYIGSLTKNPSGKKFNGLKQSQKAKKIFSEIDSIVNNKAFIG